MNFIHLANTNVNEILSGINGSPVFMSSRNQKKLPAGSKRVKMEWISWMEMCYNLQKIRVYTKGETANDKPVYPNYYVTGKSFAVCSPQADFSESHIKYTLRPQMDMALWMLILSIRN